MTLAIVFTRINFQKSVYCSLLMCSKRDVRKGSLIRSGSEPDNVPCEALEHRATPGDQRNQHLLRHAELHTIARCLDLRFLPGKVQNPSLWVLRDPPGMSLSYQSMKLLLISPARLFVSTKMKWKKKSVASFSKRFHKMKLRMKWWVIQAQRLTLSWF